MEFIHGVRNYYSQCRTFYFFSRCIMRTFWCWWLLRRELLSDRLVLHAFGGTVLLSYQRDDGPILITLRYSSIIYQCQADGGCAKQALRLIHPNQKLIDYFSYWVIALRRDMGGNRANGTGKLKVTLFTSEMTGKCIWKEIWAWSTGSWKAACLQLTRKRKLPNDQVACGSDVELAAQQLLYLWI